MDLNSLPNEILARVFRFSQYKTLVQIRKINSRFDAVAKKYRVHGLRIPVSSLSYQTEICVEIGNNMINRYTRCFLYVYYDAKKLDIANVSPSIIDIQDEQFKLILQKLEGSVTIPECDPNGKYIILENTHRTKDENLGEHKLKRKLDGNRREIVYTIPANTVLKAGKTMKIYARDQGGIHNPPDSIVFEAETTWGIGANVVTTLYNKEGNERASHNQKMIVTEA